MAFQGGFCFNKKIAFIFVVKRQSILQNCLSQFIHTDL